MDGTFTTSNQSTQTAPSASDANTLALAGVRPRSLAYLFLVWFLISLYWCAKGIKVSSWPTPVSYNGLGLIVGLGTGLLLIWSISQSPSLLRKWASFLLSENEGGDDTLPNAGLQGWLWFVAGFVALACAFVWLERRSPYFFAQDDNLAQFLPVIMQGCQGLFEEGHFPTYNPNQFAGAPTSSIGTYALTYPPTYLSYAIAKYGLGLPQATIDVFCILHLLLSYPVVVRLLRLMGCGPAISTTGSLSFVLQGYFLIAGRSWFYMCPTALWAPCLFLMAEGMRRRQNSKAWTLLTGLIIGAYFHSGNVQMWIYAMVLWCILLAIWLWADAISMQSLWRIGGALIVGFGVALPLFVPQFFETWNAKRIVGGASIDSSALGLLLPWPLFRANQTGPGLFGSKDNEYIGQLVYSGTTFVALSLIVIASWFSHRWTRRTYRDNAYAPLGFIAFASALGQMGLIWYVFSKAPIFCKFAQPNKFVPFFTLFAVMIGGVVLERILRRRPSRGWIEGLIAVVTIGLLAYHVSLPIPAFYTYGFAPFPEPLEPLLANRNLDRRVITLAPYRDPSALFGRMPINNLPTAQGLLGLVGYDPLVMRKAPAISMMSNLGHQESYGFWGNWQSGDLRDTPLTMEEKRQRIAALRAYGVDTVFVYGEKNQPPFERGKTNYIFYRGDEYLWQMLDAVGSMNSQERTVVAQWDWGFLFHLTDADPIAFLEQRPSKLPQKIRFSTCGASVDIEGAKANEQLVINVIDEPGQTYLRAYVDGEATPITVDSWMRVRIGLPTGAKKVELRYEPPFLKWLIIGIGVGLAGIVLSSWGTTQRLRI